MARLDVIRKKIVNHRRYRKSENTATPDRPSRLTDVVVALLLAVADALALAGIGLLMALAGLSHTDDGLAARTHPGVSFSALALVWMIPAALALSAFVHTRLLMPVTAVIQGLFLLVGIVLAIGETNMLLSIA